MTNPQRGTNDSLLTSFLFWSASALAIVGAWTLRDSTIGASVPAAARAIGAQIHRTGPAALLVTIAMAFDLAVGSLLVRAVRGRPYTSVADAVLFGLCGAVLMNTLTLCVLGGVGLFSGAVVAGLYGALGLFWWLRCRPFWALEPHARSRIPVGLWVFLVVAWSGPLILQLASPVVPFRDVLHNHIAPVEFVRTYHWFPDFFTSPAAETGPSRQILGYVGLLSTLSKLTGLPAVLAAAAFALPLTVLLAFAAHRFATVHLGRDTARWVLAVLPLSFVFLRLPDSRGTDLAVPLALASLLPLPDLNPRRRVFVRAVAIAATLYVHPLMGLLTIATLGLLALWSAFRREGEDDDFPLGALVVAVLLAFPELLVMVGRNAPAWIAILAVPLALVSGVVVTNLRLPLRQIAIELAVAAGIVFVLAALSVVPRVWSAASDEVGIYPLLSAGFLVYLVVANASSARVQVVVPVAVGVLAFVAATYVPQSTVFLSGSRDEVTGKTMQYWIPTFLAIATGGALWWAWERRGGPAWRMLVAAFMVAAVLPLRGETVNIEDNRERRVAETLSIDLHKAGEGAWSGWPDSRELLDEQQHELVEVFRREQAAGRMTRKTQTIHVAASRWTWVATPIAPFAGVYDTNFSEAPDLSGHTLGGRLHRYEELPAFLGGGYPYVLLEPAGVPILLRDVILAAGYRAIFRNDRGEIFHLEDRT